MKPRSHPEIADLSKHAVIECARAASRIAALAPVEARGAIFLRVGFHMTRIAAGLYALDKPEDLADGQELFDDPAVKAAWDGIMDAWKLAPDGEAMDAAMAKVLNAEPVE